eukprot:4479986-Pyramimonas_sp.AAC.1
MLSKFDVIDSHNFRAMRDGLLEACLPKFPSAPSSYLDSANPMSSISMSNKTCVQSSLGQPATNSNPRRSCKTIHP